MLKENGMDRAQKADAVAELKSVFNEVGVVVVTRNLGLTVAQSTALRTKMREAGASYKVKDKADEPFDKFPGKEFVIISVTPVLNSPFAANGNTLTAEEIKKLQDALTSDAVANNPKIFATKADIEAGYKPIFKKTKEERFIIVEDSFFDPIRELSK
jgi:hypothetical protein